MQMDLYITICASTYAVYNANLCHYHCSLGPLLEPNPCVTNMCYYSLHQFMPAVSMVPGDICKVYRVILYSMK